jgi:predicted nucleic acid-binding protein
MTPVKLFIDTNVLLRATVVQFPDYELVKPYIDQCIARGDDLWISGQVIREYFNQTTRPQSFMKPLTGAQISLQYKKLRAVFSVAYETEAVIEQIVTLLQKYQVQGKQVHDANLVAAMLVHGISTLLTLNTVAFQRYSDQIGLISPITS